VCHGCEVAHEAPKILVELQSSHLWRFQDVVSADVARGAYEGTTEGSAWLKRFWNRAFSRRRAIS
jgi:hypothetical protein